MLHVQSIIAGILLYMFYTSISCGLQYIFYSRFGNAISHDKDIDDQSSAGNKKPDYSNIIWWKIQPSKVANVGNDIASSIWIPIIVLLFPWAVKKHKSRGKYHVLFASINLIVASCFAIAAVEVTIRGHNRIYFGPILQYGLWNYIFVSTIFPVIWQCVLEYYHHRIFHIPFMYKHFHKYHHYYKAPEPFDDMYIHPIEAFIYYCILYSPIFLLPMHVSSTLFYMGYMGLTGILDHSGVRFCIPNFYNTEEHDRHHSLVNCNYAFPHPFMDILHGTFEGEYLGKTFKCNSTKIIKGES